MSSPPSSPSCPPAMDAFLSQSVFENPLLAHTILKNVLSPGDSSLELCKYRAVSSVFNRQVLSIVRQEHSKITVRPDHDGLPEEGQNGDNEDLTFLLNNYRLTLEKSVGCFQFLNNVANIKMRSLIFDSFHGPNPDIHEAVMQDLIKNGTHNIVEFRGAGDMCEKGCKECILVARQATKYGPFQSDVRFSENHHFDHLTIDEKFLFKTAINCASQKTEGSFLNTIRAAVSRDVTVDHLEIHLSDKLFNSDNSPIYPRELINHILLTWKVKQVTVKFMTGFAPEFEVKHWRRRCPFAKTPLFTRFSFVQQPEYVNPIGVSLERVVVDLSAADAFAKDFMACLKEESPENGFTRLISVMKRIFPTSQLYVSLPFELRNESIRSENLYKAILRFSWKEDEKNYWQTEMFVRCHSLGGKEEIAPEGDGPNGTVIMAADNATKKKFNDWPMKYKMPGQSNTYVTLDDTTNHRKIHVQVVSDN